jgi:hypothetical protein
MLNIVKWIATAILILGTAVNGLGYYPEGPAILVIGGFVWLGVAIRLKDWPLIITNLVMSTVGLAAIIYTLHSQGQAFQAMGDAYELRQQLQENSSENR